MWNLNISASQRNPLYQEMLESSDCVLTLDRERCIVDANAPAIRAFVGPAGRGDRPLERLAIDWLIANVLDGPANAEAGIAAFLEADAGADETQLNVIARRLDGMNFYASIRITPPEGHRGVSHILTLHEACDGAVF